MHLGSTACWGDRWMLTESLRGYMCSGPDVTSGQDTSAEEPSVPPGGTITCLLTAGCSGEVGGATTCTVTYHACGHMCGCAAVSRGGVLLYLERAEVLGASIWGTCWSLMGPAGRFRGSCMQCALGTLACERCGKSSAPATKRMR